MYNSGKSTFNLSIERLVHPEVAAEAREKYESWVNELVEDLVKEPQTIAPMVHVCIVPIQEIRGTCDIGYFTKERKEVISNKAVKFEQLSKNHFIAACKKVRT